MKKADNVIFISKFGRKYINLISKNKIKNSTLIYHGVSNYFKNKNNFVIDEAFIKTLFYIHL